MRRQVVNVATDPTGASEDFETRPDVFDVVCSRCGGIYLSLEPYCPTCEDERGEVAMDP